MAQGVESRSRDLPVIGITHCRRLDDYVRSVALAGGEVRVLEAGDPASAVEPLDGLLLTGGADVNPAIYGEPRHPSVTDAEPGRDAFEIGLVRLAWDRRIPVLGICRGAQVLNVAAGGTLVQDIPSAVASLLVHALDTPKHAVAHEIAVVPGSQLERSLGPAVAAGGLCRVNSRHHQSVARLGDGFVASAVASDGVIEAIERPGPTFCLGVQWHPENFWETGEFEPLFRSFVAAARQRFP